MYLKFHWRYLSWTTKKKHSLQVLLPNFPRDLVSRKVEEGVVWIIQLQFPQRGTVRKPIMFSYRGNILGVFHQRICLDINHRFIVRRTHSLGQGITGAKPIKSSEPNSYAYPRFLITTNQIKRIKIHFLLLDFDWCPIEVTIALHFNWTSIGSLGWIALICKVST